MNQSYEEEISLMELLGMLYKKRKQINEIRKAINILNSIDWCLKNTNIKRTKNFLFSIKNQYIEKGILSDKQLEALEDIEESIKLYLDIP